MIKIYQTYATKGSGNCMQATIASILEKDLSVTPDFMQSKTWFEDIRETLKTHGYKLSGCLHNETYQRIIQPQLGCFANNDNFLPDEMMSFDTLNKYSGVDGYYFASVLSPKHVDGTNLNEYTHAVVCDKQFNIVHDPNPKYEDIIKYPLADIIGFNGIIDVLKIDKIE